MIISVIFALSLLAGGAANAAYSSENGDYYDNYESLCERAALDVCDDVKRVRDSEGAAAVSCGIHNHVLFSTHAYSKNHE